MTIYTPVGRVVNFPMDYAFTLLARLYPKFRPHKVLKIADGMDQAPIAVAYLMGLIAFASHASWEVIFISSLVLPSAIRLAEIKSKYIDLVVYIGVIFSYVGRLGIITIGLAAFGWYSVGWQGLTSFLCGRLISGLISTIAETKEKKRMRKLSGIHYSEYDRCFIDAYRFCANKIGITLDISVSDEELESSNWEFVASDYARKEPVLFEVKKFE
jgi:hypothetical protein